MVHEMSTPSAGAKYNRRLALPILCLVIVTALNAPSSSAHSSQESEGLVYPVDLVEDDGSLVVADFKAHALLRVELDGSVSTIAQGEGLPRTPLYGIRSVVEAPDGTGWLVADPGTFGLYRVSPDGDLSLITTELDIPQGLAVFDEQSVLVSDLRGGIGAVMRVSLDGVVSVFAEIGSPKGIVADGDDGFVIVSHGQRALLRLTRDGAVSTIASGAPLDYPHDVLRWDDDTFIVSDGYAHALFKVARSGEVSVLAQGDPLVSPQGMARGPEATIFVVDPQAGAIFQVTEEGEVTVVGTAGRERP
jgi:sugar lactone lactonase YvrE